MNNNQFIQTHNSNNSNIRIQNENNSDILHQVNIQCHKHPNNQIIQGCIEENCPNCISCQQCIKEEQIHQQSHRQSLMSFPDFLYNLAKNVKKVQGDNHTAENAKLRKLVQNEQITIRYFEAKMKTERENFIKHADMLATVLMHKIIKLKADVEEFFEKQMFLFRNNMLYFKQQYRQMNPDDTVLKYSDLMDIKQQLGQKSGYQAYSFIQNLRKTAGMDGRSMSHLQYLHDKITVSHQQPPHFGKGLFEENVDNLKEIVQEIDGKIRENLIGIDELHNDYVAHSNQNLLSFHRKSVMVNSQQLLDQLNFDFSVTGTVQTYHLNSVTAMVCLTDDICATASYDRTIKVWRMSDGFLLKTLQDKNSVTCLSVLKFSNTKSNNPHSYTETDSKLISQRISDNPHQSISALGFLLISGGLDRVVKVWDFSLAEEYSRPQLYREEYEGDNIFEEKFKKVNKDYLDRHTTSMNQIKKQQLEMDKYNETMHRSNAQLSKSLFLPNILDDQNKIPHADNVYSDVQPIKELKGHARWVTAICSLEDEHCIVTGDEGGELIVWDVIPNGRQMFRIQFGQESMVNQICVIQPYRSIAVASGEMVKIWHLGYVEDKQQYGGFVKRIKSCVLEKYFNIGSFVYVIRVPQNFKNILVAGCKAGLLKYIDISKGKMVSVNTDHDEFIGDILLIEKLRPLEAEEEFFHKNMNFVIVGSQKLGIYNGYGQLISSIQPINPEDFASSTILPGRNLNIMKVGKNQEISEIKILAVSQFQSDFYNYKSSKISILSLISKFLDFV